MQGDRLLQTIFFLIWAIAFAHIAAEHYSLYWTYRWLDIPMHFVGGLWLGLAGLWVWYRSGYIGSPREIDGRALFVVVATGLSFGLLWEGYEFIVWQMSGKGLPQNYLPDTLLDLIMDFSGALGAYAVHAFVTRLRAIGLVN